MATKRGLSPRGFAFQQFLGGAMSPYSGVQQGSIFGVNKQIGSPGTAYANAQAGGNLKPDMGAIESGIRNDKAKALAAFAPPKVAPSSDLMLNAAVPAPSQLDPKYQQVFGGYAKYMADLLAWKNTQKPTGAFALK